MQPGLSPLHSRSIEVYMLCSLYSGLWDWINCLWSLIPGCDSFGNFVKVIVILGEVHFTIHFKECVVDIGLLCYQDSFN